MKHTKALLLKHGQGKSKMHYATKLKQKILELETKNLKMHEAIWWAKTEVMGKEPSIRYFEALRGNEESIPCIDVERLRKIIINLPL